MASDLENVDDILKHDNIVRMCREFCDGTRYHHAFIVGLKDDGKVIATFPGQTDTPLAIYMLEQAKQKLLERGFTYDNSEEGEEEG